MDELLYCAIAWTEHSRSLHPRLLRKGRGEERRKKRRIRADLRDPDGFSEILESSHSASLPFRILPASRPRSRYDSFLYAPPVLITIFTEWPTSPHPRRRQTSDDTAGSSPLLFGQSRAFTQCQQEFCTTFWWWISCKICWSGRGNVKVYILSVVRNKGPFTNIVISLCIPGTLDGFLVAFFFFYWFLRSIHHSRSVLYILTYI